MARPKNTNTSQLVEDVQLADDLTVNLNTMSALQAEYNDECDLLNQLLSQARMADAFAKFSVTVTTSKLAYVKENKLYRALKGQKSRNGYNFLKGTWEEFCSLLGISCEKADLDITNLRTFGEEAFDSMARMRIGYRELRQYRKLPEDQKLALIQVAKEGDKAALVDLAEELIAKHAREKAILVKELTDTKTDREINRQTLQEKKEEGKKKLTKNVNRLKKWRKICGNVSPAKRQMKKA